MATNCIIPPLHASISYDIHQENRSNVRLQRKYWIQWLLYKKKKRNEREQMKYALQYARYSCLLHNFSKWIDWMQVLQARKQRIGKVCMIGAQFQRRRYLNRWRFYIQRQARNKNLLPHSTAVSIDPGNKSSPSIALHPCSSINSSILATRSICLQQKYGLYQWKKYHKLRQIRIERRHQVHYFRYHILTYRSIAQLCRYKQIQQSLRELSCIIESKVIRNLLIKFWNFWQIRYRKYIIFHMWYSLTKNNQDTLDKLSRSVGVSIEIKRCNLLKYKGFQMWRCMFKIEKLGKLVMYLYQRKPMKTKWSLWKTFIHEDRNLMLAKKYHSNYIVQQNFRAWRWKAFQRSINVYSHRKAVQFSYHRKLTTCFNILKKAVQQCDIRKNQADLLMSKYQFRNLEHAWHNWRRYVEIRRMFHNSLYIAKRHYEKKILALVFLKGLLAQVSHKSQKQEALEIAASFHERTLLKNTYSQWYNFIESQKEKSRELEQFLTENLNQKELMLKKKILHALTDYASSRCVRRMRKADARLIYERKVKKYFFQNWISKMADFRWKSILAQRAKAFHEKKVLSRAFHQWKQFQSNRDNYRRRNRTALRHWKKTLENKMFQRWHKYTNRKKEHKDEIHAALEFRQNYFLHVGLQKWWNVAAHLREQKEYKNCEYQLESFKRIWRKVAQIANHWRYITLKHKMSHMRISKHDTLQVDHHSHLLAERFGEGSLSDNFQPKEPACSKPQKKFEHISAYSLPIPQSNFVMMPRERPRPRKPLELLNLHANEKALDMCNPILFDNKDLMPGVQAFEMKATDNNLQIALNPRNMSKSKFEKPQSSLNVTSLKSLEEELEYWTIQKHKMMKFLTEVEQIRQTIANESSHDQKKFQQYEIKANKLKLQWENNSKPKIQILMKKIQVAQRAELTYVQE